MIFDSLNFDEYKTKYSTVNPVSKTGPSPVADVSVQKDLQKTSPSRPLAKSFPRADLGDSGTRILHGIITEEYNPQLQGILGIRIFDEMRQNDATCKAALLAVTLPILQANWFVTAVSDDPQDMKAKELVEHALFDWIELSWTQFLRQACLSLAFGVMLFEKIYTTKEFEGKTWIVPSKFAPRLPKSILMWELVDRTFGIQQIRQDGVLAQIPGSKMLIFVNEREGDNWWGTSVLRAAYKHWYYKDGFYKIDAIAFERQGLGVPVMHMPPGYTESDEEAAKKVMSNLRASASAYIIEPDGYVARFLDMGSKTTRDPEKSINHHDKQILLAVLAQFLELGQTKVGAKSVSEDHSDLFLKSVESVAKMICGVINKDFIPELIEMNFNGLEKFPVLDYGGITKTDAQQFATAYAALVTAGALNPTDDDQQYVRAMLGLPPRSKEDLEKDMEDDPSDEQLEIGADIEEDDDADEKLEDVNTQKKLTPAQQQQAAKKKAREVKKKAKFSDGNKYWRPMTAAETKVNFDGIDDKMDEYEDQFSSQAKNLLNKVKDEFVAKVHEALANGTDIAAITLSFQNEYKAILVPAITTAYNYGKLTSSGEMKVRPIVTSPEASQEIETMATIIAQKAEADIISAAKLSSIEAVKSDASPIAKAGKIDSDMSNAINTSVDDTSCAMVGQSVNDGRNDTFEKYRGMIHGLQRSELLDDKTCNFCISMDGRVIDPDDSWGKESTFHSNCRGMWVAILKDEVNPPEITGIPDEVADHYGGTINDIDQPKKPITREGSLADIFVKKQAAKSQ